MLGLGHLEEHVALRRLDKAKERLARRGLATATLPDEAEDFPASDVEGDPVDGSDPEGAAAEEFPDEPSPQGEPNLEVTDADQDVSVLIRRGVTSRTSG